MESDSMAEGGWRCRSCRRGRIHVVRVLKSSEFGIAIVDHNTNVFMKILVPIRKVSVTSGSASKFSQQIQKTPDIRTAIIKCSTLIIKKSDMRPLYNYLDILH